MTLDSVGARRARDVISNTIIAVAIIGGATVLGIDHVLAPEGVLGAYGIAAAVGGLPIVVKRGDTGG